MSTTVDLPGGFSAILRDQSTLRVRQRRIIESAGLAAASILEKLPKGASEGELDDLSMASLDVNLDEAGRLLDLQDATIVAFLESWTRPEPLPTMETVGDMDTDVYDALAQATRAVGASAVSTDFSVRPLTEDSPTEPSSSSDGSLTADPVSASTPVSPSAGESTATESSTPV